nr:MULTISPECIES: DUF4157 domain-containing protein [unclassified Mycolicibacterium]
MEHSVRAHVERSFGFDFGAVRIHTDRVAHRSARARRAQAYTVGQHIVFRDGRYSPNTPAGRRLLGHELTHVLQQRYFGRGLGPQLKAQATRFQDEATLDEVSDGKRSLGEGDKGEAVIRITTALRELGFYKNNVVTADFDWLVKGSVSNYQLAKGLKGSTTDGVLDKLTFDKLDQDFSGFTGFKVERDVLKKQKASDIPAETQTVDRSARTASARAISTEPRANPATGRLPTFDPEPPGKSKYVDRIRDVLDRWIQLEWASTGKGAEVKHSAPGGLYDDSTVEGIAQEAQKAVTAVFGEYIKGKPAAPLKMGVNIGDAFTKREASLKAGGTAADTDAADWRVQKLLDGNAEIKSADREYGAIQSRPAEKAIVDAIKRSMVAKYRDKLLETHKAWPGFEENNVVYVQLLKGGTPEAQRRERWDFFRTFIHEYIHSLEHPKHIAYREGIAARKGGFTLREGTTDYFTKIVWNSITIDAALRARIEGPVNDPAKPFMLLPLSTYDEADNAERLAGVVGIRNVAAAFFLGMVDLIGKP